MTKWPTIEVIIGVHPQIQELLTTDSTYLQGTVCVVYDQAMFNEWVCVCACVDACMCVYGSCRYDYPYGSIYASLCILYYICTYKYHSTCMPVKVVISDYKLLWRTTTPLIISKLYWNLSLT